MKKILLEHRIRGIFASNLKNLRKESGLTQAEFAKKIGVEQKRVGAWEENRGFPPMELVLQIVDFFKQDLREMLTVRLSSAA